ncbi:MAG: hypothetical protein PHT53_06475 [Candidatus Omnitrophica bacterium]|nr:hypothetical protein [Candidatus Omnitrophota bacterium]
MKKILLLIFLFQLFIFPALAQKRDFYIEIITKKDTVKRGEIFTVTTSIMNVTQKEQRLCFWTCSYDENWSLQAPLNKIQFYGANCEKNIVSCVTLKPFDRFEKELYLQVSDSAKRGKATFKLGFIPCVSREECFETAKEDQEKFLSQPATVRIK